MEMIAIVFSIIKNLCLLFLGIFLTTHTTSRKTALWLLKHVQDCSMLKITWTNIYSYISLLHNSLGKLHY